jgi:hypothetical protein
MARKPASDVGANLVFAQPFSKIRIAEQNAKKCFLLNDWFTKKEYS